MESNKKKYDTNPLDPDYVKQTEESWGEGEAGSETQEMKGATRQVGRNANDNARSNIYSEAPTRRYDAPTLDAPYQSVFAPPQTYTPPPTPYQPPPQPYYQRAFDRPTSRPIPGIGLPEKWTLILPYAPFYIGVVAALLELFLVPRSEVKVRFHAAQALALHIAILAIHTLFGIVGALTDSSIGGTLFKVGTTVFLVMSMIRVWKGEPHRIAPLDDPAQWFNEHIEPRKPS